MSRWLLLVPLLVAGVCLRESVGNEDTPPTAGTPPTKVAPEPPPPNPLKLPTRKEAMEMKLKSCQYLLEGIALTDFRKIEDAAKELIAISNLTDFLNAYRGVEYAFHVEIFRRPAETIQKKAADKNIDGVMVAYNDLTLSCLKCHQAMRDKRFDVNFEKLDKQRPQAK